MKSLLVSLSLLVATPAVAEEGWSMLVGSWHSVGYSYLNQDHLGLLYSMDTPLEGTYVTVGAYYNSFYTGSALATVSKNIYNDGDISVDAFAGVAYYHNAAHYTGSQIGDTDFIGLAGITFRSGDTFTQSLLGVNTYGFKF